MFYDRFAQLCAMKGVSVTKATEEIGLARTIATKWKKTGGTPRGDTLKRIAAYFGVSESYLLQDENDQPDKEKDLWFALFRGADVDWTPPFAWTTPDECDEIMQLSIVRKFLRQCIKRVRPYADMDPEEVMKKIDKPERVTVKEIEKTQRVIKHVLKTAFKEQ